MSRKLILDLDTGIDDALAIAYALGSPEAELIGITATYGNVLMEDSVRNSLAVLDILGASSVPVHPGLPHSSTAEDFSVQEISSPPPPGAPRRPVPSISSSRPRTGTATSSSTSPPGR